RKLSEFRHCGIHGYPGMIDRLNRERSKIKDRLVKIHEDMIDRIFSADLSADVGEKCTKERENVKNTCRAHLSANQNCDDEGSWILSLARLILFTNSNIIGTSRQECCVPPEP